MPDLSRGPSRRSARAETITQLRAMARSLPELPGVYFWKDAHGETLYIGKAINLRVRVGSYFRAAHHDLRTRQMVAEAVAIEHEVTATELEALFRESILIKREQPRYNRALKQTRRLPYLKLDVNREDPWLETVRQVDDDGSLYFGPFRSWTILRETAAYLQDVLPLRKCTRAHPRCRRCMYFQMGTCAAPPLGGQHRARHQEAMAQLFSLLDGVSDGLMSWLEQKRDALANALLFERAAEVQERIEALRELIERQSILEAAAQCRAIIVRTPDKLLLVAHGRVVSVRDGVLDRAVVEQWIAAHDAVLATLQDEPAPADASLVLERWLRQRRRHVRWAALSDDPIVTVRRMEYVLDGTLPSV